jgi:hypothetical protein
MLSVLLEERIHCTKLTQKSVLTDRQRCVMCDEEFM